MPFKKGTDSWTVGLLPSTTHTRETEPLMKRTFTLEDKLGMILRNLPRVAPAKEPLRPTHNIVNTHQILQDLETSTGPDGEDSRNEKTAENPPKSSA